MKDKFKINFKVKNVDVILVPVGGGGLIAGVALAVKTLKPEVSIIGMFVI